jgi:protocatechuate 3,4-dioxygenase beta subunit
MFMIPNTPSYFSPVFQGLIVSWMTTLLQTRLLAPTPSQVAGPFFPEGEVPLRADLAGERAQGEVVVVRGDVRDVQGRAIPGATVTFWQACATGKYADSRDPNPAPLDPEFLYWGSCITDGRGRWQFRTVIPGEYKDTETWTRPPHIHFRITAPGFSELTTQMYFSGNPLNEKDLILEKTPREEWDSLIVDFTDGAGEFRIVLAREQ